MTWTLLVSLAKRVPLTTWLSGAAFAGLCGVYAAHLGSVRHAYDRGRADVLADAQFDTTLVALTRRGAVVAEAHTDTIIRLVSRSAERVTVASSHVPDTVRVQFPVVDTLVIESQSLARSVDSLTRALASERAASALLVATLQTSEHAARLAVIRAEDRAAALSHRPRWSRVILGTVAVSSVSYAVGRR